MTAITACRICGNTDLQEVMNLGAMALTGIFPRPGVEVPRAPLRLLRCAGDCGLVQLEETYELSKMYGDTYGYRSGLNKSMVMHLQYLIDGLTRSRSLGEGDVVVDIGSNDGTALGFYPETVRRIGVDPSAEKFRHFYKPGIELIPDFFSAELLKPVLGGQKADVVTSFAMFYDLEDPLQFMREVEGILSDTGVWLMEQSYLPAMLRANAFDTICHEHIEYYSLRQIEYLADKAGLEVLTVRGSPTNGGSFIVALAKKDTSGTERAGVQQMRDQELHAGLGSPYVYDAFRWRCSAATGVLEEFLVETKRRGQLCCGLGASTKGNVVLQSLVDARDLIPSIGDVNPDKWGCVTPGTGIPIWSEDEVLEDDPDFLLVLPWHFRDNFINNPKYKGRRLVFPLPQLEIVQL